MINVLTTYVSVASRRRMFILFYTTENLRNGLKGVSPVVACVKANLGGYVGASSETRHDWTKTSPTTNTPPVSTVCSAQDYRPQSLASRSEAFHAR